MDLVFLACLAASPINCHEERVLVSVEQIDPRICMATAIPTLAEWSGDHPEWQISRWRCGSAHEMRVTRNAE